MKKVWYVEQCWRCPNKININTDKKPYVTELYYDINILNVLLSYGMDIWGYHD